MPTKEERAKSYIAETLGKLGVTGIVEEDDDGNEAGGFDFAEMNPFDPPEEKEEVEEEKEPVASTPVVGHGDEVFLNDIIEANLPEKQLIGKVLSCLPIDDIQWEVTLEVDHFGTAKMEGFTTHDAELILIEKGDPDVVKHCCEAMDADVNFDTSEYAHRHECSDIIIHFEADKKTYGVYMYDGSWRHIKYCPWCGTQL